MLTIKLSDEPQGKALQAVIKLINVKVKTERCEKISMELSKDVFITSPTAIARHLARLDLQNGLYGSDHNERTQIDHWLEISTLRLPDTNQYVWNLEYLNNHLSMATYLVGESLTLADVFVLASLKAKPEFQNLLKENKAPSHVVRYYNFISEQVPLSIYPVLPSDTSVKKERKAEGKFVALPEAEMGKVVVRFPPEASGYLHIGHAKASLLNQYYQQMFDGKLILRFDDTNPEKENEEFEKVILEDVALLGIVPDLYSRTSNYFDDMLNLCKKMITEGKAYADDTDPEVMKKEREERVESKNRNNSVEKNLSMWEEMQKGTEYGLRCCIRAKLDMSSDNGCLRDPTMYRCKLEEHVVTGNKYKVYPTYDFACPIVDSVEGVTHALRTMEYHDRDEQYYWFIDALGLRKPVIWEYSRLNLMNTVMSKRKLTWLVNEKIVDGWDDPRFPTVRGVLRRGMTVQGLKEFVIAQGSSRAVTTMEWDKIWAFNKKVIDPLAPRYVALQKNSVVPVFVRDAVKECKEVQKHPKEASVGMKTVWYNTKVLIDGADAAALSPNEIVTFINWGNLTIEEVKKDAEGKVVSVHAKLSLENKDFKNTQKLTWLPEVDEAPLVPTVCYTFDHIISKPVLGKEEDFKAYINRDSKTETAMLGDPELKSLKKGDIIQLQRRGFFICDAPYEVSRHSCRESPCILFNIPDGHTKEMPVAGSKFKARNEKKIQAETKKEPAKEEPLKQNKEAVSGAADLDDAIHKQGDLIRELKVAKTSKDGLEPHIKKLLDLKKMYKDLTGQEWKPSTTISVQKAETKKEPANEKKVEEPSKQNDGAVSGAADLDDAIHKQGDLIRELKVAKTSKDGLEPHIKKLLDLKKMYKDLTGQEWKPSTTISVQKEKKAEPVEVKKVETSAPEGASLLNDAIIEQGNVVRELKAKKAPKEEINQNVAKLLFLKKEYEALVGGAWTPSSAPAPKIEEKKSVPTEAKKVSKTADKQKSKKEEKPVKTEAKVEVSDANGKVSREVKKVTRLGMEVRKDENFSEWYSQVITKAEMIEYYDVSGCYVLRPWAFGIWEKISDWFDAEIKKIGFENCYFPMFVSHSALETEKEHIADFAPEVAWVTKSGNTDLAEPIAIRPTSETVMYPSYAKWVQSHRDLPIKLNQWCNVVRWEFKHPQPFLRTREFLWQEGHSAHNNYKDAEEEVYHILDLYSKVYQDLLAVPVIKGRKTEKEKFAGGDYTTTIEAYIPASGRGIQAATSHHLGQNFSKMFDISFEDVETGEKKYAYQNSWGLTTRSIGVVVMVHGDDKGLVLPPRIAQFQVVIVPCGITAQLEAEERQKLLKECDTVTAQLAEAGVRVKCDPRDNYSPGWKFNHWELKGVPIRIEIGPKDLKSEQFVAVRRDTGMKSTFKLSEVAISITTLLEDIHRSMFEKAQKELDSNVVVCHNFDDFCSNLDLSKLILAPFCGGISCEEQIKKLSTRDTTGDGTAVMGAKGLCIPFEQPAPIKEGDKCVGPDCSHTPLKYTLFGRSY